MTPVGPLAAAVSPAVAPSPLTIPRATRPPRAPGPPEGGELLLVVAAVGAPLALLRELRRVPRADEVVVRAGRPAPRTRRFRPHPRSRPGPCPGAVETRRSRGIAGPGPGEGQGVVGVVVRVREVALGAAGPGLEEEAELLRVGVPASVGRECHD